MTSGPSLTRRTLLKGVATAAVGSVIFTGCREFVRNDLQIQSPVLIPEDLVPGIDNWYATIGRMTAAGNGLIVRVMQGRAKKIEGNPDYPVNLGKHAAIDEGVLQVLYHPDRIKSPLRRSGDRGSGQFAEISWDEALNELRNALDQARNANQPGNIIAITEPGRGHQTLVVNRFVTALGGQHFTFEPMDQATVGAAIREVFGQERIPEFDIARAQFILSFGADFLGTWLSPVHYATQYGTFRQGSIDGSVQRARGVHVHVEPRFSLTAANADRWIPNKPGTEGVLALSIAQVLVSEGLADQSAAQALGGAAALDAFAPERVAEQTGVDAETIREIARAFGTQRPALAIGGGPAAAQTNGLFNLRAIYALNYLVGSVGQPGGVLFNPPSPIPDLAVGRFATPFAEWQSLTERLNAGQPPVAVALIHNANPVYGLPGSLKFGEALARVGTIVSFSNFLDETTALADLILPDVSPLEAWGSDVPEPGPGYAVVGFQQPVVRPFYPETRSFGDVLLTVAKELGPPVTEQLPWNDMREAVRDGARQLQALNSGSVQDANFEQFWVKVLQRGGWWDEQVTGALPAGQAPAVPALPTQAPEPTFSGDPSQYPYHLIVFESVGLQGRLAADVPWAQSTPDPLTTVVWTSWLEINPETARNLGIEHEEIVAVQSEFGEIEVPAFIFPAAPPDVVSIPIGQGRLSGTRYAQNRGANPMSIIAPRADQATGSLAWAATRVRLRPTGRTARMPAIQGSIQEVRPPEGVELVPTTRPRTS